jgi:LysR family transcriptional regulator, glycine cleavage system transcriptional activator
MQMPPLQTVRAFDAAVRLGSFARAADELGLTASAVSHHMRGLEQRLHVQLFLRQGRGLVATEAALVLHAKLAQGLTLMEQAFADAHLRKRGRALTVSVLPAFASRWLIPRLEDFQRRHPGMDINLRATQELVDLTRDGVDVAIRYGPGAWAGLAQLKLRNERLFPVCSPHFRGGRLPVAPKDLAKTPLLRHTRQPWTPWFKAAGLKLTEPARGLSFNESGGLLQAAAEGHGVALARAMMVEDDLKAARLVRLFDVEVVDRYAWYAVWQARGDKPADVSAFCAWLTQQMAASD